MAMDSQLDSSMGNNLGAFTPNTLEQERVRLLPVIKNFRQEIDALIQRAARGKEIGSSNYDVERVREEVSKKLQEAKMWAGKMLEALGNPFPAELADKANVQ